MRTVADYPRLVAEFDRVRNRPLTPRSLSYGSARKVWWRCDEGPDHRWEMTPNARTSGGEGCPFCAGKRVSVTNSLARRAPRVAAEWYQAKNRPATPETTHAGTHRKFWWKCSKGHTWQAEVASRVHTGAGCPYCSHRRASFPLSLAVRAPALAAQWHPTKNGELRPDEVLVKSNRKVWWKCPVARDHVWLATVGQRTRGPTGHTACPFCCNRRLARSTTLAVRHPEVAAEWHPTRNRPLSPAQVSATSMKRAFWRCKRGHVWSTRIHQRTQVGTACPYCGGWRATPERCLARLHPEVARRWHPTKNGALTPRDVLPGSIRRVWWKCPEGDDHEWESTIAARVAARPGSCPFCSGRRLCSTNSLARCYPRVAREWHPRKNGKLTPADVTFNTSRKVWWRCVSGHEWQATVVKRAKEDHRCPHCRRRKQTVAAKGGRRRAVHLASYEGPRYGPVRRVK